MNQSDLAYIKVPYPDGEDLHFKIAAPVCKLVIAPGLGNAWATGKYYDPKFVAPLSIQQSGKDAEIVATGAFAYRVSPQFVPQLRLSFGRRTPFSLSISAGIFCERLDFGGLPLSSLDIQHGGGSQVIDFSYPNPEWMRQMKIIVDTGPTQIEHLAHANAEKVRLSGDSTSYRVNFGGELMRSMVLHIGGTVSQVDISAPENTAIKVITANAPVSNGMGHFSYAEHAYWNSPARDHQEPLLEIANASGASLCIQPN